nr:hypothetical protein [Tanacetum cinerariifolium]
MDKVHRSKRIEVHARLDFGEGSMERRTKEGSHYSSARILSVRPERLKVQDHLRYKDRHVLERLGHRRRDASNGDRPESKECFRSVRESYDNSHSYYETGINHGYLYHDRDRSLHVKRERDSESLLSSVSKSDSSDGRHWKSKLKRHKPTDEDALTMPWMCEETYDGTGDPEDHVKIFQAAAQVERWAMPTWCHMFNSTLIGAARVWFDELPSKSIDSYKDLKATFLAYFMQQKKYIKYPVEIHNIKQKDGETIKDFMEQFKMETGSMKGTPEFKAENLEKRSDFQGQPREGRRSSRFTSLTRTPKEILAAEAGKFQPPPPMVTLVEKRISNKFCDFHNDKGHNTDECMQLKKHIEELVRAGKLSHLIKEIKHGRDQSKVRKKETPAKDKPMTIYMIQSWQRLTRQKVTQSFKSVREITFPSLATSSGTEGPLVIEADIGGHMIHRMYVDGGSSMEVLYAHWFNRLWPEVKNQMVPATTSLTGFSGETIWSLGQLRLLNKENQALLSTAYGMLKFPADGGIVTIHSTILIPAEYVTVITSSKEIPKEAGQPSDMTGVLRSVAEHRLNIREGYSPFRQKKSGQAPERAKAIKHSGGGLRMQGSGGGGWGGGDGVGDSGGYWRCVASVVDGHGGEGDRVVQAAAAEGDKVVGGA